MSRSILIAVCVIIACATAKVSTTESAARCDAEFAKFAQIHAKPYSATTKAAFCDNLEAAEALNRAVPESATSKAIFSAFTKNGATKMATNLPNGFVSRPQEQEVSVASMPSSIDWRQRNAVTAVWNEGACGSTWSFPILDNIAALWYLAGNANTVTQLSAQEIVSCDGTNNGCNGGVPLNALRFILDKLDGKILTNKSFPYASGEGSVPQCRTTGEVGATIKGLKTIPTNESAYAAYVGNAAPMPVAINALPLQTYTSGIIQGAQCGGKDQQLNHAVTLVGYDDDAQPPYWIVKNMWGTVWGENGYFRMEKGVNCLGLVNDMSGTVATLDNAPATPAPTPTINPIRYLQMSVNMGNKCSSGLYTRNITNGACTGTPDGSSFIATCVNNGETVRIVTYAPNNCTGTGSIDAVLNDVCTPRANGEFSVKYKCK